MQLFNKPTKIDFMGKRKLATIFSSALIIVAIVSLAFRGLNFGLDFTGGTLIELGYKDVVKLSEIRDTLENNGYDNAVVQHFGTAQDVLIRLAPKEGVTSAELSNNVITLLRKPFNETLAESSVSGLQKCYTGGNTAATTDCSLQVRRVEFVGPQVGDELTEDGGLAMIYALIGILVYVAFRFEYRFAIGSVAALIHDVTITLGVFSVFQLNFDLTVLAALLAVIGYSLNDTIVVFDRVRENFRKMRKGSPVEIVNSSLNQTLSRTLMTSFTTLLVLFALFIFGGELIHNFALALIVGIVIGTYSSIYVASAFALLLGISKADLMPVKKEGAEFDERP
jgi:preprotein translocase subunit SecF